MRKIEALLSDADGTLVDTVRLIRHGQYETSLRYLTNHGIPPSDLPSYENYERLLNQVVGGSARDTLERTVTLLYQESPHHLNTINFDELHEMLNPIQDEIAEQFVSAYEGLSRLLSTLGRNGLKLAIFTSGTPHHVVRNFGIALPELGVRELFKEKSLDDQAKLLEFEKTVQKTFDIPSFTVITANDTATHKPNPEGLLLAMDRLRIANPLDAAVIGDHPVDMQAAINANVQQRIGVTHGFSTAEELSRGGASETIDELDELTDFLA